MTAPEHLQFLHVAGAFGTVYEITNKATGEVFAVKQISKAKLASDEDVMDVRREMQVGQPAPSIGPTLGPRKMTLVAACYAAQHAAVSGVFLVEGNNVGQSQASRIVSEILCSRMKTACVSAQHVGNA